MKSEEMNIHQMKRSGFQDDDMRDVVNGNSFPAERRTLEPVVGARSVVC